MLALPSRQALAAVPMVAAVLDELGVDVDTVLLGGGAVLRAQGVHRNDFGVFHVAEAEGSSRIPDQRFVVEHGVRSVVGFGGMLPEGQMFVVLLFSRTAIEAAQAQLLATVAVSVKLALLDSPAHRALGSGGQAGSVGVDTVAVRMTAVEQLLQVFEESAIEQTHRAGVAVAELRAALAAEALATRRLSAMIDVASELSRASTVAQVTTIVMEHGLSSLRADGAAVAVRGPGTGLYVTITRSSSAQARREYSVLDVGDRLPTCVAVATGRAVVLANRAQSLAWEPGMGAVLDRTGCQAWVSLPLGDNDPVMGSLTIAWAAAQDFTEADLALLGALAAQCTVALERIRDRQGELLAATVARRMSETLQRSMLTEPAKRSGLEFTVRYRAAAHEAQVGGDWYDAFTGAAGSTLIVIGDVAGHDGESAAVMGQARNLLRGVAATSHGTPAQTLARLDAAMHRLDVDALATVVLAEIGDPVQDEPGRRFTWSNAGHPPPVLLRADGTCQVLSSPPDLLVGLDPHTSRSERHVSLCPGDIVLLYTDGLIERRGAGIDEGIGWLQDAVRRLHGLDLDDLCDALLKQVGTTIEDDVAMIAVRSTHPHAS